MAPEQKRKWSLLGGLVALLGVLSYPVVTAAASSIDARWVKRDAYDLDRLRDSATAAVKDVRDSAFQADVRRDLQILKGRR